MIGVALWSHSAHEDTYTHCKGSSNPSSVEQSFNKTTPTHTAHLSMEILQHVSVLLCPAKSPVFPNWTCVRLAWTSSLTQCQSVGSRGLLTTDVGQLGIGKDAMAVRIFRTLSSSLGDQALVTWNQNVYNCVICVWMCNVERQNKRLCGSKGEGCKRLTGKRIAVVAKFSWASFHLPIFVFFPGWNDAHIRPHCCSYAERVCDSWQNLFTSHIYLTNGQTARFSYPVFLFLFFFFVVSLQVLSSIQHYQPNDRPTCNVTLHLPGVHIPGTYRSRLGRTLTWSWLLMCGFASSVQRIGADGVHDG